MHSHTPTKKQGSPSKAKKPRNSQKYSLLSQLGLHSAEVPKSFDSFCELSSTTVPESKYNVSLVKASTNETNGLCISTISLPFGTLTNFGRGKLFAIFEQEIAEEQAELKVVETSDGVEVQLEFRGGVPMAAKFFNSPDCVTLEKHRVYSFNHSDIFFVGPHVFRVEILKSPKAVNFGDTLISSKDFQSKLRMLQQKALQTTTKPPTKGSRRKSVSLTTTPSLEAMQPSPKRMKECVAPPPPAESSALTSSPSSDSSSSFEDLSSSLTPSSDILSPMSRTSSDLDLETGLLETIPNGDDFYPEPWAMAFSADFHTQLDFLPGTIVESAHPFNL